jgi:outer membrane receptor protein involved in Fe transport
MRKIITLLGFLVLVFAAKAQNGDISGKVVDQNGEPVPLAAVQLVDAKGVPTGRGSQTDFDGNYSISPLTPGKYNLKISSTGFTAQIQEGVVVNGEKTTFIDIKLKSSTTELKEVEIITYKVPLIDPANTSSKNTITSEEIANMATKNVSDIAATTAGVFQSDQGGTLNVRGGREDGTQYYVDGVKVLGVPVVPVSSIEQLQVITGGVPARYGDLSGGVINITTKGPASQINGSVEVQTTQGLDAYGYNLVDGSLTGPLWKEKKTQKTIIGFFLAFEYLHQNDPNPSAIGIWQVRPNVLDSLQQFPLVPSQTAQGFNLRSAEVSYADMFKQQVKPNTQEANYRGNGRIDIRPADNITLSIGGSIADKSWHSWVEQYTLFNSVNNPQENSLDWRVYGRFTHNVQGKVNEGDEGEGKKKKSSAFQNAYYSVQVDYEKYKQKFEGNGGFNPFNYGYIGKFDVKTSPSFVSQTDTLPNHVLVNAHTQTGIQDTAVVFTPGTIYPTSTRYTEEYYQLLGAQQASDGSYEVYGPNNTNFTQNIFEIQQNQGLINGQRSNIVNNIWYNTGRSYNGYGYTNDPNSSDASVPEGGNSDQYRVRLEGAFDILKPGAPSRNKHSFEFGVEYEQRIERTYQVLPLGVWQLARDLTNLQFSKLDLQNPIAVVNGVQYKWGSPNFPTVIHPQDTILYNLLYNDSAQSWFDKQLRRTLNLPVNGTSLINIDALSPTTLNMKMFSPDELLNNGYFGSSAIVQYKGYDPYGNVLTTQPSFNDFFTKKDANGNYVRGIPAYRPIYADAYLSDRFYFKDLTFNVGVRIDRFDANQSVLKDPYTLYPILTASEVTKIEGNPVTHPSDIGGNYAVYVDNALSPSSIVGYRNGDTWYDKYGTQLTSGALVAAASSTGTIQPYLKNPTTTVQSANFDPTQSFQAYTPQIIVMPRLQFSFNLTDRALFYAHYDILSQRPTSQQSAMDPTQYLFFDQNIGGVLNNPNLKPQQTIDYELGFKQRVSNSAAFTVSAFYREFRNQIQIEKIIDAYPKDYLTYGNVDFGTTKGFTLDFDLRRTANFSLKANYTLQFADGTGSDPTTQLNIVTATGQNFRTIAPLSYDSRHLINVNLTYSYGSGKDYNGPTVKNKQILSEAGISFQVTARSGTPYTAQSNVTAEGLIGQPNRPITEGSIDGSRLPWYFRVNMRVFKDFTWTVGKKKENTQDRRQVGLEIYLQIQNLLGTENWLNVYRYTGVPSSDGYLNDPASLAAIAGAINPQAFKDQYAAYINKPGNYSLPRRVFLGGIFTF